MDCCHSYYRGNYYNGPCRLKDLHLTHYHSRQRQRGGQPGGKEEDESGWSKKEGSEARRRSSSTKHILSLQVWQKGKKKMKWGGKERKRAHDYFEVVTDGNTLKLHCLCDWCQMEVLSLLCRHLHFPALQLIQPRLPLSLCLSSVFSQGIRNRMVWMWASSSGDKWDLKHRL